MRGLAAASYVVGAAFAALLLGRAHPEASPRDIAVVAGAIAASVVSLCALAFFLGRLAWTAGDPQLASGGERRRWWWLVAELIPAAVLASAAAAMAGGHALWWTEEAYHRREAWLLVGAIVGFAALAAVAGLRLRGRPAARVRNGVDLPSVGSGRSAVRPASAGLLATLGSNGGFIIVVGYPLLFAAVLVALFETASGAPSLVSFILVAALATLAFAAAIATIGAATRREWGATINAGRPDQRTGVVFRLPVTCALGGWATVFAGGRLYREALPGLSSPTTILLATAATVVVMVVRPDELLPPGRT